MFQDQKMDQKIRWRSLIPSCRFSPRAKDTYIHIYEISCARYTVVQASMNNRYKANSNALQSSKCQFSTSILPLQEVLFAKGEKCQDGCRINMSLGIFLSQCSKLKAGIFKGRIVKRAGQWSKHDEISTADSLIRYGTVLLNIEVILVWQKKVATIVGPLLSSGLCKVVPSSVSHDTIYLPCWNLTQLYGIC